MSDYSPTEDGSLVLTIEGNDWSQQELWSLANGFLITVGYEFPSLEEVTAQTESGGTSVTLNREDNIQLE